MRNKKILSLLLSLVMVLSFIPSFAADSAADAVTVFLTVSKYGEIVKDNSGAFVAEVPVTLSADGDHTLDSVFSAAHELYYGAENGYLSENGDYGLYVKKFWGDESGNFGYQINGGTKSVYNLSTEVENGDFVDAVIYKNQYPDTESYTKFDEYTKTAYVGISTEFSLSVAGYDENWNMVFSPCSGAELLVNGEKSGVFTDEDGKAALTFDADGTYTVSALQSKTVSDETVPSICAPVCVVTAGSLPDASITVPSDAKLFVGEKGKIHFVKFTEHPPVFSADNGTNTKYWFDLADGTTYNFRVSGENYVTYGGIFKKSADFSLDITPEQLMPSGRDKTTVDRDKSSNGGCNTADIYLNINPGGYLKLSSGDTYQIVSLRNWEAINNYSANYFIEPDYHYNVIDEDGNPSDIASVDENGILTANKKGTAIVLVTYDAMTLDFGSGSDFYGAIYPENTGVFVVSVDADGEDFESGMTVNRGKNTPELKLSGDKIDAEHDCIYFTGDTGEYTFTPSAEVTSVSAANPTVTDKLSYSGFNAVSANSDGSYTVPLTEGRNIVRLESGSAAEYQIITAKQIKITVSQGDEVHPGDTLSIAFDTLYHPANKLAGVYNMSAQPIYTSVSSYDGKYIGGTSAQYNFANSSAAQTVNSVLKERNVWDSISYEKDTDLTVPDDYAYDTFTLSGGAIYVSGFGDSYGSHRFISYETGKAPNLNATAKLAFLGTLPDIEIPIVLTDAELLSITADTQNAKTEYYSGDKFDTSSITVTANYADGKAQIVKNYTVSPEILDKDTKNVTISYRGKTVDIPVTVTEPKLTGIEITTKPTKTAYTEGEVFDPSGMVVSAVYENGRKITTNDYSYTPNKELETTDTEMTITYTGADKTDDIAPVTLPITVSKASSGGSTADDTITVYFTLLGDSKHGTPSGSSDTHTLVGGNLTTWISRTKLTLSKDSYVIDAVRKALSLNGIPFTIRSNYISEIRGLAEFSNGKLSGWMYTLNNKYPNLGVEEQKLSNNNEIVFHYTDDYTVEKTNFKPSGGGSSSGGSAGSNSSNGSSTIVTPPSNNNTSTTVKFSDINGHWAEEYIKQAASDGIMNGTSANTFSPEEVLSRAMLVTVLWRMENKPQVNYAMSFEDVPNEEWYTEAVRWAASEKIVNGFSDSEFGSDTPVSREQTAAILYRYAQYKDIDTSVGENTNILSYSDASEISEYAIPALCWTVGAKILSGKTSSELCPTDTSTRAEIAAIIVRFKSIL